MPVIFDPAITVEAMRANPEWLYLFGDNEARTGRGGLAAICRGEPNALGVATKRSPSMHPSAFWSDGDYLRCAEIIDRDMQPAFDLVARGGTVVCPAKGIGTGTAQLPTRAPRLFGHIRQRVKELVRLDKQAAEWRAAGG